MLNHRHLRLTRTSLFWTILISGIVLNNTAQAMCYSTPRLAINAITTPSPASETPTNTGYRVAKILADPILRVRWAIISNCARPEWPQVVLSVPAGISIQSQNAEPSITKIELPVVRAGEIVRLWKDEGIVRIEVTGVSEESGGIGKKIQVRLLRKSNEDEAASTVFPGIIRGPSNVEMQR